MKRKGIKPLPKTNLQLYVRFFGAACLAAAATASVLSIARFNIDNGEDLEAKCRHRRSEPDNNANDVASTESSSGYIAGTSSVTTKSLCMEVGDANEKSRSRPKVGDDACLLHIEPTPYVQLLSDALVGLPSAGACDFQTGCQPPHKPYREHARKFGDDWPPYGYTMIGKERLANFRAAILEVNRNNVSGAIAEFGVWRGGTMIMAAALQKFAPDASYSNTRELYLFDAFGSFGEYSKAENFLAVPEDQVKENFRHFGIDVGREENIHFVKGLFSDTVVQWVDRKDPIAVLRVDGNFYSSYQDVLYAVYENVPVGGIVIFDDVYHPHYKEVMQCWLHFKADHDIPEDLVRIDRGSGWFRKKKDVTIDQSKKREAKGFQEKK